MKFHVPDMSCGHCVYDLKGAESRGPDSAFWTDLKARTAEINTTVSSDALARLLADAGILRLP